MPVNFIKQHPNNQADTFKHCLPPRGDHQLRPVVNLIAPNDRARKKYTRFLVHIPTQRLDVRAEIFSNSHSPTRRSDHPRMRAREREKKIMQTIVWIA